MIYTVGHSTRAADEFLRLLQIHGIRQIADVRSVPQSRRHPHFSRVALEAFFAGAGIGYRHFPDLGGLRKPRANSVNSALHHAGFRGYADHMETTEFQVALLDLVQFSEKGRTAAMCAEAVWWQCHRRLLADALLVHGVPVRHILSAAEPKVHILSEFAREIEGRVTYPGLL